MSIHDVGTAMSGMSLEEQATLLIAGKDPTTDVSDYDEFPIRVVPVRATGGRQPVPALSEIGDLRLIDNINFLTRKCPRSHPVCISFPKYDDHDNEKIDPATIELCADCFVPQITLLCNGQYVIQSHAERQSNWCRYHLEARQKRFFDFGVPSDRTETGKSRSYLQGKMHAICSAAKSDEIFEWIYDLLVDSINARTESAGLTWPRDCEHDEILTVPFAHNHDVRETCFIVDPEITDLGSDVFDVFQTEVSPFRPDHSPGCWRSPMPLLTVQHPRNLSGDEIQHISRSLRFRICNEEDLSITRLVLHLSGEAADSSGGPRNRAWEVEDIIATELAHPTMSKHDRDRSGFKQCYASADRHCGYLLDCINLHRDWYERSTS